MNIKKFISAEYAKENKQNKRTAKQFKANEIQEQAEATEELIAALTDAHTRQMETLIKSTTDTMKEMMLLIKESQSITNSNKPMGKEKKERKSARNTMTHQFVSIVEEKTHQSRRTNAGSSRRIKTPAWQCGSQPKAPEGAWGVK
jgi:hypothetical protein